MAGGVVPQHPFCTTKNSLCMHADLRTDSASGAPICRSYILLCHDYLEDFLFSMVGVMGQQLVIILDNIIVWVHFGEKISQVN